MRKQVELLEHHPNLAAHLVDRLEILGKLGAVDDDATALPVLDPVDAAKQRRLAAARGTAYDDALSAHDFEVDVAQHMESPEPFVELDDLDRDLVLRRAHVEHGAASRSVRCSFFTALAQALDHLSTRTLNVQAPLHEQCIARHPEDRDDQHKGRILE